MIASAAAGCKRLFANILQLNAPSVVQAQFSIFEVPGTGGGWLAALDDFRNWLIREAA